MYTRRMERIGDVLVLVLILLLALAVMTTYVTAQSGITDFTSVRLEDALIVSEQSTLTVTDGLEIPSDGSYQPLTAAGAVWTDDIEDGQDTGQLLYLQNVGAQNIVISETAAIVLSGDTTLAANDTLTVVWDGDDWVEFAQTDN